MARAAVAALPAGDWMASENLEQVAMPASGADPAPLSVREVSYAYGRHRALSEVSFTLQPGRVTALLGPNGAGKTTLFSLVTGLFDAPRGEIAIAGHTIRGERSGALSQLVIVFPAQTLDLDLSVEQNLGYFAALRGMTRAGARARIDALLGKIGLAGQNRTKVRRMSGGQRRRVEVARALLDSPRLLLLDEPSTGLDIQTRRWLIDHLHRLAEEEGISVLLATHLVDEVEPDDDLIVLDKGSIVAAGRVADVVAHAGAQDLDDAFTRLTGTAEIGS
jgi:ABC-2 type transport system ATP-binding protein